jgi:hypothetical protein
MALVMAASLWAAPAAFTAEPPAAAPGQGVEPPTLVPAVADEKPAAPAAKEAAPAAKSAEAPAYTDAIDEFIAKSKTPVPWFRWGADIRFRDEYINGAGLNHHSPARGTKGDELNYQRYRPRWWATLTPAKDIDLNMRIMWEGRHWSAPDGTPEWVQGGVLMDILNLKLTNVGGSPLTMTLGRQDLMLGDGWLVMDGTPTDGSRTFFFDAARFTYDAKNINTTIDAIYIQQSGRGNDVCPPLLDDRTGPPARNVIEQDERGVILWAANKSIKNTEIDGYYMYKDSEPIASDGDDGHIHTFGARVAGDATDHWRYRAEGAYEFGSNRNQYVRAFGLNSGLTYLLKDKWNNQWRAVQYEYLSGDDPHSRGTNEAFKLLWGRWTRWNEIIGYGWSATKEGRARDLTNMHRLTTGWSLNPVPKVELAADYHLLFAAENTFAGTAGFSEAGAFRGQLVTLLAKFDITKHLKAHILQEYFFPGNYYAAPRDDPGVFLRGELYFTW